MSDYPPGFDKIIGELERLTQSGTTISERVINLKTELKKALVSLNEIASKTSSINDLIRKLKDSLADLERKNNELERLLESSQSDFQEQMAELQSRQRSELEAERQRLEAEKEELEQSFLKRTEMSESQKAVAVREAQEAAEQRAREQAEQIRLAHEEERGKLVAQYQKDYDSLLEALTKIARRQAEAINQIGSELNESEQLTTEFATVQQQILGLLASISQMLDNTRSQGSLPPPPPMGERQQFSPLGSPSPREQSENLLAPDIDFDELEASGEPIPEQVSNVPSSREELFKFMLITLAQRARTGLGPRSLDEYERLKGDLRSWQKMSEDIAAGSTNYTPQMLKSKKVQIYTMTSLLFNSTKDIQPTYNNEISLVDRTVGGSRTRRHRRRVHFKTRAKKGGKGGKKGGRKSHKGGRSGGKRSGGKRTRKH